MFALDTCSAKPSSRYHCSLPTSKQVNGNAICPAQVKAQSQSSLGHNCSRRAHHQLLVLIKRVSSFQQAAALTSPPQSVTFVLISIQTNLRIYFYQYTKIYKLQFILKMTRIFKYSNNHQTLPEYDFDMNIFVSRKRYK